MQEYQYRAPKQRNMTYGEFRPQLASGSGYAGGTYGRSQRDTFSWLPKVSSIPVLSKLDVLPVIRKRQLAVLCAAGAALAAFGGFSAVHRSSEAFFDHTYAMGLDISGQTAEEAADRLIQSRKTILVSLTEDGQYATSGTPADFGFILDEEALRESVVNAQDTQRKSIAAAVTSLFRDSEMQLNESWTVDDSILADKIDSRNLVTDREPSYDAQLIFSSETGRYEVQAESYGNQFDAQALNEWIKPQLTSFFQGLEGGGSSSLSLEIPKDLYRKPTVKKDDPSLSAQAAALNEYADTVIEYTFGQKTKDLTFATFRKWMSVENGSVSFNIHDIANYVVDLAEETDTRGLEKDFVNHWGETVHFDDWQVDYGYRINQDAETELLAENLKANTSVSRDPIYYKTNKWDNPWFYSRNGLDDLNGTYIEVSIYDQHVWFYKNGELIVEGDCVTGNHAKKMDTTPGVYPISYKRSPAVLKGGSGSSRYETPVNYWMPFNGGQGLHDATWRGSFGGKIYRSNGSHGCVNLPKKVAKAIYENCSAGMPVVVY